MRNSSSNRIAEIVNIRRLQAAKAQDDAGRQVRSVQRLESERDDHKAGLDKLIEGYRGFLGARTFDPVLGAGWLEEIDASAQCLATNDERLSEARATAIASAKLWNEARGRQDLAETLWRSGVKREIRAQEDKEFADVMDLRLIRSICS